MQLSAFNRSDLRPSNEDALNRMANKSSESYLLFLLVRRPLLAVVG